MGPTISPPNRAARVAAALAQAASGLVATAGLLVLAGWMFDIRGLTSLFLPGPTLKTNAALSLTCGALANLLLIGRVRGRWSWFASVLAIIPVSLGGLTWFEHLTGIDLLIDQLLATEPAGALATVSPNRMGPPASIANVLLGVALLGDSGRSRSSRARTHALALAACVIATLPLMGFAYGFSQLYAVARYTGISLVNAVAILTLGLALQAGRPDGGLVALVCRSDEVGVFARRLLPAGLLLPFVIGWLLARSLGDGIVDAPFAISTMALVLIVVLAAVIWRTGTHLVQSLDARTASEEALLESERVLRAEDQRKTEFLATLSHELRNPLAPIRFAVEILKGPPTSAERARRTIERQVQHLTRLIDDLLDLTRINRNKLELHPRPSELALLIGDAADAVAGEMEREHHRLQIMVPPEPTWLQVDPDRMVQILVNLLTNAARYTNAGGQIQLVATVERDTVAISVRDNGQGIDAQDLTRVFERFVQVGESRHGGLGIGLALVKALVELHGGSVVAHSSGRGCGAEIRVVLPQSHVPAPVSSTRESRAVSARRVLVVDDNRDAADMLGGLLQASGHQVLVAYDGEEALREALEFKPHVGLLDIGMSGMNGYELAARLRADSRLPELFLVAITGWGRLKTAAGRWRPVSMPISPNPLARPRSPRFSLIGFQSAAVPICRERPSGE